MKYQVLTLLLALSINSFGNSEKEKTGCFVVSMFSSPSGNIKIPLLHSYTNKSEKFEVEEAWLMYRTYHGVLIDLFNSKEQGQEIVIKATLELDNDEIKKNDYKLAKVKSLDQVLESESLEDYFSDFCKE